MGRLLCALGSLGVLLIGAGCQARPAALTSASAPAGAVPREPVVPAPERRPQSPTLKARMRDHDVHGGALRDAIARADLDATRREAKILAELRLEGGVEPTWRKNLDAMNAAAARVAEAKDLTEASRGLASLARTCGDCHATLGGPSLVVGEPPAEGSGTKLRMQRHQWAAGRLWDGIVVPSDDAWRAAARVLSDAPLEPESLTPGKSPVPAVRALAAAVHELGRKASVAKAGVDRSAIYGELMTTCSACHQRLGGGPAAAK